MVEPSADISVNGADLPPEMLPICAHHWQIETPAGESSLGRCKLCGTTRSFLNYSQRRTMARTVRPPAKASSATS